LQPQPAIFLENFIPACGFACPRVLDDRRPKNLKTPSLPDLNLATFSGFFQLSRAPISSIESTADLRAKPSGSTISAARVRSQTFSEHFFPDGSGVFACLDQLDQFRQARRRNRTRADLLPLSFEAAQKAPVCIQLAVVFPGAPALAVRLKIIARSCEPVNTCASYDVMP